MAELVLITALDPGRLLDRAADRFLVPRRATLEAPFPSPSVLLALRQGGLRDDVIRRAAERGVGGWYDPPLCVFHELGEWLGSTPRRACGEVERLVLLRRVFRGSGGEVFSHVRRVEDFVEAVSRLFGELCAEDVAPDAFARAMAVRPERDAFETRRDRELVDAYRRYRECLDEQGVRDGRDGLADSARALGEDPGAFARRLGGRREIRFFGLSDLRGGWRVLLRALVASPVLDRVEIHTAAELDLGGLPHRVERLDEPPSLASRLFGTEPGPDRVRLVVAPGPAREAEEIAVRIRSLIDGGTPLHCIGVVPRQARPQVDKIVRALEAVGVPAIARQRRTLVEIPVVRALLALFDAATAGWTRAALAEIAEHPYFDSALHPGIIHYVGYRERVTGLPAWEEHLVRLLERAVTEERGDADAGEEVRGDRPPTADRVRRALDGLRAFRARAEPLSEGRPLVAWLRLLTALLDDDPWRFQERMLALPDGRVQVARPDLAGWKALRGIATEWRGALERWGGGEEVLAPGAFALALREALQGEIALWTGTHRGVVVQEATAAAYRAFDHLFVVGMEAGTFPVRAPASPILDEAERDALIEAGLPLDAASAWGRREAELFRSLVAGARDGLTLSYAAMDAAGREVIASSFVEAVQDVAEVEVDAIPASRVLTPGFPLIADPGAAEHAHRVATVERVRETGRLSPYNGRIEDPELLAWLAAEFGDERLWSPTQLETFAKCPWSYFAGRLLRLEAPEDPCDDLDPMVRGRILHAVLERLYVAARERSGGAPVLLHGEGDRQWAFERVQVELDAVLADVAAAEWIGHPALHAARRAELLRILRKYLAFELEHNRKLYSNRGNNPRILRTGVVEHELGFDDVTLEVEGIRFRFRGFIDRVEEGIDERVPSGEFLAAVDYKTTRYSVPGAGDDAAWDDGVVLQIPLYAYALERLRPGHRISRVEYRSLKPGSVEHGLQLYGVSREGELVENDEARERMANALASVATHVRAARGGEFPARPAPSCGCSPYCVAWDVCRVRGGPEKKGR
jgi:ATP-dependent helicase/nuclease subunit B